MIYKWLAQVTMFYVSACVSSAFASSADCQKILADLVSGHHGKLEFAREPTQALRDELTSKLRFEPGPFAWKENKVSHRGQGTYEVNFPKAQRISNLPPVLANLEGILDLRRVSLKDLTVYHETTFSSLEDMVKVTAPTGDISGRLRAKELKLTNPQSEPAFYTHIDPTSGVMLSRSPDLLLKVEISKDTPAIMAFLRQPSTEAEWSDVLTKLKGKPVDFRSLYDAHSNKDGTEFDIFHNQVVTILREKYGIPVDVMFFQNKMAIERPTPTEYEYLWFIFYNRELLREARVPKVFYQPLMKYSDGVNVNDANYTPISKEFVDFMKTYPEARNDFVSKIQQPLNYLPYKNLVLDEVFGKGVKVTEAMQREWYDRKLQDRFLKGLLKANNSDIQGLYLSNGKYDISGAHHKVFERAIAFWKSQTHFK